ncbi:hypothetical protein SAMN06298211_10997 [Prevotellaceae bacterium MN60]|nr:hypothetical protein SAMN06298211_10997 [Prevotellaceae bacterium MN60]
MYHILKQKYQNKQERIAINYTLLKLIFTNIAMYYSLLGAWGR